MNKSKRFLMTAVTVAVLLGITVFSLFLSVMSYASHLKDATSNLEKIRLIPLMEKTSYSLTFGKSIDKFYGMEAKLREVADEFDEITNICIADDEIIYSAYPNFGGSAAVADCAEGGGNIYFTADFEQNTRFIIEIDSSYIYTSVNDYFLSKLPTVIVGLLIAAAAVVAVGLLKICEKRIKVVSAAIMVLWQLFFGTVMCTDLLRHYYDGLETILDGTALVLEKDISSLTSAGIRYDELTGIQDSLADYCADIPEFDLFYIADYTVAGTQLIGSGFTVDGKERYLVGAISSEAVGNVVSRYLLESGMVIVISLLVITEFQILLLRTGGKNDEKKRKVCPYMRTFVFIVYGALYMGMSFNPVAAKGFAQLIDPASDFLVGVPTTLETAAGFVVILLCAGLLRKFSIKQLMRAAVLISALGLFISGIAADIAVYSAGRVAVGAGCGLVTIVGRTFALAQPDAELRTTTLSSLSAGSIAGLCFGTIFGGVLHDQLSSSVVYIVSAVLILLSLFVLSAVTFPQMERGGASVFGSFRGALGSVAALKYLILVVMPIYACSMFISYSLSLLCSGMGMSTSQISALILLNSLISGYASPTLTRLCMKHLGAKRGVILYIVITAGAILAMSFFTGIIVLIAGVILLGAAESFGIVVMTERLAVINPNASSADNMIMFTLAGKVGQASAPTVISLFGNSNIGLPLTVGVCAVIYLLTGAVIKKRKHGEV